jgi:anti-sigma-K factor RskA
VPVHPKCYSDKFGRLLRRPGPLPASKIYEAWLINPRRTRPAGLLPAPHGGKTRPLLATELMPGDELGLTVEPAGGTAKPTTTPILVIPLRA